MGLSLVWMAVCEMRDVSGIMQELGVYKDGHFSVSSFCVRVANLILIDCSENLFTLPLIYPTKLYHQANSKNIRQG